MKQAEWNLPASRHTVTTGETSNQHTEIVNADMGKVRTTCYIADCPNTGCRRLKPLIDLHVSTVRQFDAGKLQSDTLRCSEYGPLRPADECRLTFSPLHFAR